MPMEWQNKTGNMRWCRKTGPWKSCIPECSGAPLPLLSSSPMFYWRATSPLVQMTWTEVAPPLALAVGPCTDVSNRNKAASGQWLAKGRSCDPICTNQSEIGSESSGKHLRIRGSLSAGLAGLLEHPALSAPSACVGGCSSMEPATEQADTAHASGLAFWNQTVPIPHGSFSATSVITVLILYSRDRYPKRPVILSIYSITVVPQGVLGLFLLLLHLQDLDWFLAWSGPPNKY